MHPVTERSRTAQRSLVACLEIVGFAAGAHVVGGGHLPGPGFLLALAVVVGVAAYACISRRLRAAVVVPFVLVAQVALHASLEAGAHAHAGMAMAPAPHAFLNLTPPMIWAHLVTSVLTAIVLLVQEHVLAVLTTFLRELLLPPVAGPRARRAYAAPLPELRRSLLGTSPRRGPPVLVPATS
ncbi:MAG: hypothetical protein ACJ72E_03340 [Marmoricola sp.]